MDEENLLYKLKEVLNEIENLEKHYRQMHNSAVDIDDYDISRKVQADAYSKIRKIKEWKNTVAEVTNNIVEFSNNNTNSVETDREAQNTNYKIETMKQTSHDIESEVQIKIGEYVSDKMHQLSNKRFIFSYSDICLMKGKRWSSTVLGLEYPFVKIYNSNHDITEQTDDDMGYNLYCKETFRFGKYELLLANRWNKQSKRYFDAWFSRFNQNDLLSGNI